MLTKECQNRDCCTELREGDKIYHESYYGGTFCSVKCLITSCMQEYDWSTTTLVKEEFEGEKYLTTDDWRNHIDLTLHDIIEALGGKIV